MVTNVWASRYSTCTTGVDDIRVDDIRVDDVRVDEKETSHSLEPITNS